MKLRNPFKGFTKLEWALFTGSLAAITAAHFAVMSTDYLSLAASLTGAASLIFAARGDPLAPVFFIAFSVMYAVVSYFFGYYGEAITYIFMQLPVSVAALFTWRKNAENHTVRTARPTLLKTAVMLAADAAVTAGFYFLLKYLNTPNLIFGTVSVATSFAALFFMCLRLPQYALLFVLNDIVMIVLWSLALAQNIGYISILVCVCIFLINDIYTFISWIRRAKNAKQT